jgi:hypothetical protein
MEVGHVAQNLDVQNLQDLNLINVPHMVVGHVVQNLIVKMQQENQVINAKHMEVVFGV